ncbi:hypothetical protein EH223_20195 [candidate division KSB1 bacterium]|nr:hypothetical protein [candidate division KSB1 bacterium]RQW00035.1 MAG: hypothetical protein EH223_20195 [candidate division KSB1 bacterium]
MSEQDLEQLVEKIILRVLQRIQADEELSKLLKIDDASGKDSWARTCASYRPEASAAHPEVEQKNTLAAPEKKLYTENDILEFAKSGQKLLLVAQKTLITPAARDAAKRKGIKIKVD